MNCPGKENLSAYYDGELSDLEQRDVGDHLNNCADCRLLLSDFQRTSVQLQALSFQQPTQKHRGFTALAKKVWLPVSMAFAAGILSTVGISLLFRTLPEKDAVDSPTVVPEPVETTWLRELDAGKPPKIFVEPVETSLMQGD